jgi:transcriptional regulator with XRE-family HTH domain
MRVGKKAKLAIKPKSRSTGSFDVHFGEKLRARRLMMDPKVSQADLGKAIGLTFQQVQKYEKGNNRMSAAMMVQIAAALKVNVQYFFEELPRSAKNGKEIKTPVLIEMSLAAHGPRLIDAFLNLKSDKLRGAVADLAQALVRASAYGRWARRHRDGGHGDLKPWARQARLGYVAGHDRGDRAALLAD